MKYLKPILAILGLLFKMIPLQVRINMAILILRETAKKTDNELDDKIVDEVEIKAKKWTKILKSNYK
jgi:hypothetical protein